MLNYLFKNDSGDNFEDCVEILLEMFLVFSFSYVMFYWIVYLCYVFLYKKGKS